MKAFNPVYADGSASIVTADKRLRVNKEDLEVLVGCGLEVRRLGETGPDASGYVHQSQSRRTISMDGRKPAPTWVAKVRLRDPDGKEYVVVNLAAFTREHFGSSHRPAYIELVRKGAWRGWRVIEKMSVGSVKRKGL